MGMINFDSTESNSPARSAGHGGAGKSQGQTSAKDVKQMERLMEVVMNNSDPKFTREQKHFSIACGGCHGVWSEDPVENQAMRNRAKNAAAAIPFATAVGLAATKSLGGIAGTIATGFASYIGEASSPLREIPTTCERGFINDDPNRYQNPNYGHGTYVSGWEHNAGTRSDSDSSPADTDAESSASNTKDIDNSGTAGNAESTDAGGGTGPGGACENGRGGYD